MILETRKTGIAFDMEELDPDICAMAAPVFNAEGIPIAAIVVATLAGHLKRNINSRKAIQLKKTADKITEQLKKNRKIVLRKQPEHKIPFLPLFPFCHCSPAKSNSRNIVDKRRETENHIDLSL